MPDLLYCADPLDPRRVDDHYRDEARLVRELGATVARVDHDALLRGDAAEAVRGVPRESGPYWYRGWMLPSARYADLEQALAGRDCLLLTDAAAYRTAHELPGWYDALTAVTPLSAWQPLATGDVLVDADLDSLVATLPPGPAIVKDYVKSRKHDWDSACFIPDLADRNAVRAVVSRFVELQDDSLAGGVVLRAFEDLLGDGDRATEARVWWLDGTPVLVGPHPDDPDVVVAPPLDEVAPLVAALPCRFVTTDLAQRADGAWLVIELGDGQVSDFPAGVDQSPLLQALIDATASRP